jgi:hypothetical protein
MRLRTVIVVACLAASLALPATAYGIDYPSAPPSAPVQAPPTAAQLDAAAAAAASQHRKDFGLASPTYVPPGVNAEGVFTTPLPPGAKTATATYNLDWTIGVAGKSGCLVCHGDRNLVRIVNGKVTSLFVDSTVIAASAHAQTLCTDCHVDFAYKTPHPNTVSSDEWRILAKSACKNCHRPQFLEWANSAHSTAGSPSPTGTAEITTTVGAPDSSAPGKPRPLCGDCHGGHAIPSKTDSAAIEAVRASALEMCGKCHTQAATTYDDYYHGAAYRRGAKDAPACWQCHNTHLILPSANRLSWTNNDNLLTTCGQCHKGTLNDQYTSYSKLVHRKSAVLNENPVFAVAHSARQAISNAFYQVGQVFRRSGS